MHTCTRVHAQTCDKYGWMMAVWIWKEAELEVRMVSVFAALPGWLAGCNLYYPSKGTLWSSRPDLGWEIARGGFFPQKVRRWERAKAWAGETESDIATGAGQRAHGYRYCHFVNLIVVIEDRAPT